MADTNIATEYKAVIKQIADAELKGASEQEVDALCIAAAKKFFPESRQKINDSLNDDIDAFLSGKPITRFESRTQERTETRPQERTEAHPKEEQSRPQPKPQQQPTNNPSRPQTYNEPRKTTQVPVARAEERLQPVVQQTSKYSKQIDAKEIIPEKQAAPAPTRQPLPGGKYIDFKENATYNMIAKAPDKGYMSAMNINPDRLAAFIKESIERGDTAVQALFEQIQARREK